MNLILSKASIGFPGDRTLLSADDWSWKAGGVHVVFGANGSGKSTMLRSILGLIALQNGEVHLEADHQVISRFQREEWVKSISFVASKPPAGVGLTAREVLSLSGPVHVALERNPRLQHWLDTRLSNLSDGQAQQVMVGRAMIQSRHWVVMDEPFAFLDVRAQKDLWHMVETHVARGGSVLLATHDVAGFCKWKERANSSVIQKSSLSVLLNGALEALKMTSSIDEIESYVLQHHEQ